PNPFNPTTTIEYELPLEVKVNLVIYDNLGRQVRTLVENVQPAGYYKAVFDAQGLSSGMYYYRIVAGDFVKVKKLLFVK
ncbi:MAG TPA: T9SS type A sorting domain-containing protein, partial [Bacteroidota bacterium]|nr:T9SS type A sorting domain-containing protein [Bacteroidota bacterium]